MANVNANPHDLEEHITELKALDKIRRRSALLRDEGAAALSALLSGQESDEDEDLIQKILAARILYRTDKEAGSEMMREVVNKVQFCDLSANEYYILTTAQLLHAVATVPQFAFKKLSFECWYAVVREIYTAYPGEWIIGAARVNESGWATAFTTAQCMKGMLAFETALRNTGIYFSAISNIQKASRELDLTSDIPEHWRMVERERILASASITISSLSRNIIFDADELVFKEFGQKEVELAWNSISGALDQALTQQSVALKEVENLRRIETKSQDRLRRRTDQGKDSVLSREDEQKCESSELKTIGGHKEGLCMLQKFEDFIKKALQHAQNRDFGKLSSSFFDVAQEIHDTLQPCRKFLSSVIDRQLATRTTIEPNAWDPAELAFAASAYCEFETPDVHELEKIKLAARFVAENIGLDGVSYPRNPFHRDEGGDSIPGTIFVLNAATELFRHMQEPIAVDVAAKLLPYFDNYRRIDHHSGQTIGWAGEYDRQEKTPQIWTTAGAIDALTTINRALDETINAIVLEHFSVKRDLNSPDLDSLFYPDFGLASIAATSPNGALRRESIAITMQRMRGHIHQAAGLPPLHSLVLYGPAGTGKTTLLEALAKSCNVPLVEVTPSDISKSGEDAVERRARVVFEALSLLTRAVILFDEFDPVLRRRDVKQNNQNIFSFLTPGMLPKLKTLNEEAKRRSVVYALITNYIGVLDEAAVRQGRFDLKVGIYPPDPLSRYGRFQRVCEQHGKTSGKDGQNGDPRRLTEIVSLTAGLGMTALMKEGWFRKGKDDAAKSPGTFTPLSYVFGAKSAPGDAPWPEPEEYFRNRLRGEGAQAIKEYREWHWINAWDTEFSDAQRTGRAELVRDLICNWPNSDRSDAVFAESKTPPTETSS